jgi:hypothetical protein
MHVKMQARLVASPGALQSHRSRGLPKGAPGGLLTGLLDANKVSDSTPRPGSTPYS